jgi:hypothetical protein
VLYLAQVEKKSGFIRQRTSLRLMAQLGTGMVWNSLPHGQVIPTHKANEFREGTLVMVHLDSKQTVSQVKDATSVILSSLVNVSVLQKKLRDHQRDIDEWKSSLINQTQILNQRKLEIERHIAEMCHQDIDYLLQDLRQVYYQYFQVTGASKKMIVHEGEMDQVRRQLENSLMISE